jgi:sugar phosphate isomerase/epimerase
MAIQLGTVAPIGFPDFPPADWLACFRRLGCTVVQAYRNQKADISLQEMKDYIAAGEMPCDSLHGVFGEEFDSSACSEPHRQFAADTYKKEGELARELGGPLVVVAVPSCATGSSASPSPSSGASAARSA